jgi:hypothetical protein
VPPATILVRGLPDQYAADTDADMNKELLLKVLNGTLTPDEETMFNDLKKQIQTGKTSKFFNILFKPLDPSKS